MNTYSRLLQPALAAAVVVSCFFQQNAVAGSHGALIAAEAGVDEYYISCDPDEFAHIYKNFTEDIYIPATVAHRDKTWTVQLRLRGDSSREYPKKSLKLKTEDDTLFANGRDVLNFNAEYQDNSFLHSILGSRLFADIGYPCFQAKPARLYLNGSFLGLYIDIENMDDAFLIGQGLDPKGNLYKATYDGACLSPGEDVYTLWEKKTNEHLDRSDLEALINRMNSVPDDQYEDFARKTFDYDRMIDIIAMNMLLGNGSTYYHNYYMYHNPTTDKWMMLPWDLDRTLTAYGVGFQYQRSTSPGNPDNPFLERALVCEPILADIKTRVQELSATVFNIGHLGPVIDSLKTVLAASVAQDTSDLNESIDKWYSQLDKEKEYITHRTAALLQQMAADPRTFRIIPTKGVLTPPVHLRWHRAADPDNDAIAYSVRISTKPYFPDNQTQIFNDITDTAFAVASLPAEGMYYWTVSASDGKTSVDGFDKLQSFVYRNGSVLSSPLTGTVVLTKEKSPYIADGDIIVESGSLLRAQPGAEIRLQEAGSIVVFGEIQFAGTAEEPVRITGLPGVQHWSSISFREGSAASAMTNVIIDHGSRADVTGDQNEATIDVYKGFLMLDSVTFVNCYRGVRSRYSELWVSNSHFPEGNYGEAISVLGGTASVENCEFHKIATTPSGTTADAITIDSVPEATLRFNRIFGAQDNGIDIGSSRVALEGNELHNCLNNGVFVDGNSVVEMKNNIISSCHTGIAVKEGASAQVDRSTLYNNVQGCAAHRNSSVLVVNTIIAESQETSLFSEEPATLDIRYSLSDTDILPGPGSLHDDPQFVDAESGDFHLAASSPCIDAGDPAGQADPDGSRPDMGAKYFSKLAAVASVVINEIAYNPDTDTDTDDWVELYNPDSEPVDLSGWIFRDEDDSHTFTFPANTILAPHGYIVICADTAKFRTVFPNVHPIVGNTGFGLAGGGELVRLYNSDEEIVDSLTYDDKDPWPTEPDGNGPTLELIAADLDNALGQSWKASKENNGTPGAANSNTTNGVFNPVEEKLYFLNQNYPNPFAGHTTIEGILLKPAYITVEVYDALGKPVRTLFSGQLPSGKFTTDLDAAGLVPGQYLYVLRVDGKLIKTRSATVIR